MDLEEAYALPAALGPGPHVRANFVTSLDGAVELDGHSRGLSSPADQEVFSTLRGLCDVILVGAGTARQEGYGPARPGPARQEARRRQGLSPVPPVAVVTRTLELDLESPMFTEAVARPIVITVETAVADRRAAVARRADLVLAGQGSVSMDVAVDALAERGLSRILCEGGPTLLAHVAAAGRLDELCLSLAPLLAGPGHHALLGPLAGGGWPVPLDLAQILTDGATLFMRYLRARAGSGAG